MGARGSTREALLLSAFIRTELACKGVNMVSTNPYKLKKIDYIFNELKLSAGQHLIYIMEINEL